MASANDSPLSFEDSLRLLEQVVDDLERGEPELSVALGKYEQGVRWLARCQAELDRAERSVALLTGVDPQGEPITTPFDASPTANPEATPKPGKRTRRTPPADDAVPF